MAQNIVRSLKSANRLNEYQEVFNQWEREGIIEQIHQDNDISESLGLNYLPHIAVFLKTPQQPRNDIPAILNRFRWGKIGVISDTKQVFLQLMLKCFAVYGVEEWRSAKDNHAYALWDGIRYIMHLLPTCSCFESCIRSGEKIQRLKSLSTFKDADGILRIKTKLLMREDNENFKIPIVLPSDYHVVKSYFVQTPRAGTSWSAISDVGSERKLLDSKE
ncbi:DUF1758 domain-containing protein [Nephila pilipes]|uniref:DUF1758 domain-containing protein n=1 Tax=Nephila pilipes TaxID=299642 RepID=A0A8X6N1F1_NEPPI|nr:DUF1758 domain-containing protein [Nephila pilipes]